MNGNHLFRVQRAPDFDLGALLLDAGGGLLEAAGGDAPFAADGAVSVMPDLDFDGQVMEVRPQQLPESVARVAMLLAVFSRLGADDGARAEHLDIAKGPPFSTYPIDTQGAPAEEASTALVVPLVFEREGDGWQAAGCSVAGSFSAPEAEARLSSLMTRAHLMINLLTAVVVVGCIGSVGVVTRGDMSMYTAGLIAIGLPAIGTAVVGLPLRAAIREARREWRDALVARAMELISAAD